MQPQRFKIFHRFRILRQMWGTISKFMLLFSTSSFLFMQLTKQQTATQNIFRKIWAGGFLIRSLSMVCRAQLSSSASKSPVHWGEKGRERNRRGETMTGMMTSPISKKCSEVWSGSLLWAAGYPMRTEIVLLPLPQGVEVICFKKISLKEPLKCAVLSGTISWIIKKWVFWLCFTQYIQSKWQSERSFIS